MKKKRSPAESGALCSETSRSGSSLPPLYRALLLIASSMSFCQYIFMYSVLTQLKRNCSFFATVDVCIIYSSDIIESINSHATLISLSLCLSICLLMDRRRWLYARAASSQPLQVGLLHTGCVEGKQHTTTKKKRGEAKTTVWSS